MNEEYQKKHNIEILESFNSNAIKRRLKKELDNMYIGNRQILVELNIYYKQQDDAILYVNIHEIDRENKSHWYKFGITIHYPFRNPHIYYQGRPYLEFLQIPRTIKEMTLFKKVTKLNCYCCNSYNCSDNWTPMITLQNIIDEIKNIKQKKRDLINKIIADKIKHRYLISDIDLDSWLF